MITVYVNEAENLFIQLEKMAAIREWKKDDCAWLVQTKLTGKAREVYACLTLEESTDNEEVKEAVLRTTEQDPEIYRKRFRDI